MSAGDKAVVATAIAGCVFFGGVMVGEYRTRQQIATICDPQQGAQLASSTIGPDGLTCTYIDDLKGRSLRKTRKARA